MSGTFPLGTIAGVRVRASYSWVVVLALLVATLAASWLPQAAPAPAATYLTLGVLGALFFAVSVALHEAAHVAVARYRGLTVSRMVLYPFGGVSDLDRESRAPSDEFPLAVAGPLANFLLAWGATLLYDSALGSNNLLAAMFLYLNISNALLGLFNLIPGYPLDGGRLLRAFLAREGAGPDERGAPDATARRAEQATPSVRVVGGRRRSFAGATRRTIQVGQLAGYLLVFWGIWRFFSGEPTPGLWLAVGGFILLDAARATSGRAALGSALAGVTVGEVMRPAPPTTLATGTLQQLVDEQVLAQGLRAVPVAQGGRLVGLITLADVARLPRDQWARTVLSRAMTPLERLETTTPEASAARALAVMAGRDIGQLPVLQNGRFVGMVSRGDLLGFLDPREDVPTAAAERAAAEVTQVG